MEREQGVDLFFFYDTILESNPRWGDKGVLKYVLRKIRMGVMGVNSAYKLAKKRYVLVYFLYKTCVKSM